MVGVETLTCTMIVFVVGEAVFVGAFVFSNVIVVSMADIYIVFIVNAVLIVSGGATVVLDHVLDAFVADVVIIFAVIGVLVVLEVSNVIVIDTLPVVDVIIVVYQAAIGVLDVLYTW